jgi:hypothetical protein
MKTTLRYVIFLIAFAISVTNVFSQTNCLYGWYKLDGTAADSSGNNLNGTLTGTTPATDRLGNANGALYFNGVSDKVNFPSNFDFPQRTISLWFKTETFTSNVIYTADNNNINYGSTIIQVENTTGTNEISFHSSGYVSIYNDALTNTWYHVAFIISPNFLKSYVNGALIDSIAYSGYGNSANGDNYAKLGTSRNNDRYFNGTIDDVKIFDCDLSNEEIYQLYSGQTNCLYGWYKLDGTAADSSGNNLNGTLTGTAPATDHLGNANGALYFNGVSDKVNFPSNFDFPQRTISLWFKAEIYTNNVIYTADNNNINYGSTIIQVENTTGTNEISFHSSGYVSIYNNALTTNTWYHVAFIVSPNYLKSYVNGTLIDSIAYSGYGNSADGDNFAKLGTSRNNDRYFKGAIDDVKIFNCVLDMEEIDSLYTHILNIKNETDIVKVFPNPATNNITIESPQQVLFEILNIQGQKILQQQLQQGKTDIDISVLAKGFYILRLNSYDKTEVLKFLKE